MLSTSHSLMKTLVPVNRHWVCPIPLSGVSYDRGSRRYGKNQEGRMK